MMRDEMSEQCKVSEAKRLCACVLAIAVGVKTRHQRRQRPSIPLLLLSPSKSFRARHWVYPPFTTSLSVTTNSFCINENQQLVNSVHRQRYWYATSAYVEIERSACLVVHWRHHWSASIHTIQSVGVVVSFLYCVLPSSRTDNLFSKQIIIQ